MRCLVRWQLRRSKVKTKRHGEPWYPAISGIELTPSGGQGNKIITECSFAGI
jgi:hypothetical protein